VGEVDSHSRKSVDGENYRPKDWQEDQEENLF
jgi:hypothetical protein